VANRRHGGLVLARGGESGSWVMIYTPGNLPPVKKIAERYPGLNLIIDHMGIPRDTKDEEAFRHIGELCEFARFSNVAVKASALPCYSSESYPYPKLHPYVKRAYDAFGPNGCSGVPISPSALRLFPFQDPVH